MRTLTVAAAAAAILLLAGCTPSEDPRKEESASPSASASPSVSASQAAEADLEAACDALGEAVTLPGGDAVEYTVGFYGPAPLGAPVCDIEPEGEYYDVAAAAGLFGRAEFNYGIVELPLEGWIGKEWDPERAQDLLTLDQADPLTEEVPCANEPCENDIHGYFYNFRIETLMDDIVVQARIDYITTDVSGDQQDEYREQAIAAFTASMDVIAAELH